MASASPAVQPTNPSNGIDFRRQADYPILLGNSIKENRGSENQLINFRFNYQPKLGFSNQNGKLTASENKYRLVIPADDGGGLDDANYVYSGRAQPKEKEESKSLALIFDKAKSAFVLESLSTSLDMNLVSAPGRSQQFIRGLPKLRSKNEAEPTNQPANITSSNNEDDDPDSTNPFDFRHFINEARENLEKHNHQTGNRTPLPGNRTPMSGLSSPNPSATRVRSNTPQFRPTTTKPTPTSAPIQKKRKLEDQTKQEKPTTTTIKSSKSGGGKQQPALSKERITDSDSTSNEDIKPVINKSKPNQSKSKNNHKRTVSSQSNNNIQSPHIVVNDGDLEIDMGSPPQSSSSSRNQRGNILRQHHKIDPEAFRSHTSTPNLGRSPNVHHHHQPRHRGEIDEIEIEDDNDNDVEKLDIGSPRRELGHVSNTVGTTANVVVAAPPTPSVIHHDLDQDDEDDDEDEDLLARELEAALDEEEEEGQRQKGFGLGISSSSTTTQNLMTNNNDDESEVSEEE